MHHVHRGLAATVVCALSAAAVIATPLAATAAPAAPAGIRINEVESSGGTPGDWIELFNTSGAEVALGGYSVRDSDDTHVFTIAPGTTVAAGGYLVIDELVKGVGDFDFGLGGADTVRLYDAGGARVEQYSWTVHAATTWGRTDTGDWALTTVATKSAANTFAVPEQPEPEQPEPEQPEPEQPEPGRIVINEVDSQPADWVEFYNAGIGPLDISGYEIRDNSDDHRWAFPAGTAIAAGEFLVVGESSTTQVGGVDVTFGSVIGIGSADKIRLYDAGGALIDDSGAWTAHAAIGGDVAAATLARCPDGVGDLKLAYATPGVSNRCVPPATAARINEVESSGGTPGDWVELVNPTASALDVSGLVVRDNDDDHTYVIPAGTTIAAGGYLVIDEAQLGFGLGGADSVRLFEGDVVRDSTSWTAHAGQTWGRCPDAVGDFGQTQTPTKGAANACPGDIVAGAWPGSPDVTVVDASPTFLEDSSGLDTQLTADGLFLWAVDNGTGTFWKLAVGTDGTATFAPGWEHGKRARYQKDALAPAAAGPDTEGITVDDAGWVYLASERDNSAKGVNKNVVLMVDPAAPGPDVVATREWDLTALLPAVGANLGIEAVEWVSDADLSGRIVDANTHAPYAAATYAGSGLFFVAVEDGGGVFAFDLASDGTATLVATFDPGLPGVMALDYDIVGDVLWAVCDDGCGGTAAQLTFNGTETPTVAHVARPASMPDINNEGFATSPVASTGTRSAWWFADGYASGALRVGTLPGGGTTGPVDPTDPTDPTTPTPPTTPTTPTTPSLPVTGGAPLTGHQLVDGNRGGVTAPGTVTAGGTVTISVGARHAGVSVSVWMYSTPQRIGAGALDAQGRITVRVPADAPAGAHRLAVFDAQGNLLGWTDIRVTAASLATTGGEAPWGTLALGALTVLAGAALVWRRRATA